MQQKRPTYSKRDLHTAKETYIQALLLAIALASCSYYLLFIIYYLSSVIYNLSSVIYNLLSVIHYLSSIYNDSGNDSSNDCSNTSSNDSSNDSVLSVIHYLSSIYHYFIIMHYSHEYRTLVQSLF